LSKNVQLANMQQGLLSLREDADALLDEMDPTSLYGKLFSTYQAVQSFGSFDPRLDNHMYIQTIMHAIDAPAHLLEYEIESSISKIQEYSMEYMNERSKVIEELRSMNP